MQVIRHLCLQLVHQTMICTLFYQNTKSYTITPNPPPQKIIIIIKKFYFIIAIGMLKSFWNLKKKKGSANKAKIFCEKFLDWEFVIGLVAFMFVWSFKINQDQIRLKHDKLILLNHLGNKISFFEHYDS